MRYQDLIGVGGSVESTLTARLSQSPDTTMLRIETGGENDGILHHVPIGAAA
jgi:hypothetical protein